MTIVKKGGINSVLRLLNTFNIDVELICLLLSNLTQSSLYEYSVVKPVITTIFQAITQDKFKTNDYLLESLRNICIYTKRKYQIQLLLDSNLIPKLIQLLGYNDQRIVNASISILGEIAAGSGSHRDQLINCGLVDCLPNLLAMHRSTDTRKATCWLISNIAAGSMHQVQLIIFDADLMRQLVNLFKNDAIEVKHRIGFIFRNFFDRGQPQTVAQLLFGLNIGLYYVKALDLTAAPQSREIMQCFSEVMENIVKHKTSDQLKQNMEELRNVQPEIMQILLENEVDSIRKYTYKLMYGY